MAWTRACWLRPWGPGAGVDECPRRVSAFKCTGGQRCTAGSKYRHGAGGTSYAPSAVQHDAGGELLVCQGFKISWRCGRDQGRPNSASSGRWAIDDAAFFDID
jgi:hypothetical protein